MQHQPALRLQARRSLLYFVGCTAPAYIKGLLIVLIGTCSPGDNPLALAAVGELRSQPLHPPKPQPLVGHGFRPVPQRPEALPVPGKHWVGC